LFYEWHETIPPNTTKRWRGRREVYPGGEVLQRVEVMFPDGCAGLARCQLYQGSFQIGPTNPGGDCRGNGFPVSVDLSYDMEANQAAWYWYLWNLDDTYDHTLTLRMVTCLRESLKVDIKPEGLLAMFKGLFGRFKRS